MEQSYIVLRIKAQWGSNTIKNNFDRVTFPISFVNFSIVIAEAITDATTSEAGFHLSSKNLSGFAYRYKTNICYLAIGK